MRKLSALTMMVITATSLAIAPSSVTAPILEELLPVMEVEAATQKKVIEATDIDKAEKGNYPIIKKTGNYTIESDDTGGHYVSFKAPKEGTYVLKFKNLREDGKTAADSNRGSLELVAGTLAPDKHSNICDFKRPIFWSGYIDNSKEKSWAITLGTPSLCERDRELKKSDTLDEYYALPGSLQPKGIVKVKLKKGESLYFILRYTRHVNFERNAGYICNVDLSISMR